MSPCASRYWLGSPWEPEVVACEREAAHEGLHEVRLAGEVTPRRWSDVHAIGGELDRQDWEATPDRRARLRRPPGLRRRPQRP